MLNQPKAFQDNILFRNSKVTEKNHVSISMKNKHSKNNKCNSILDIISSVDSLGISPSLYIEKSTSFKTVKGGILTLLLYIFGLTTFFVLGRDLYLKKSPFIVISKNFLPEPSQNITQNDFFCGCADLRYGKAY